MGATSDLVKRVYLHKENWVEGFTQKYGVHQLVGYEHRHTAELDRPYLIYTDHWIPCQAPDDGGANSKPGDRTVNAYKFNICRYK